MNDQPWWRKDVDEMWAMFLMALIVIGSVIFLDEGKDVALAAIGGFATYLGKGKTGNGN